MVIPPPPVGEKWEADRDGTLYWAYDDSIKDEKDPNCAKWFTINGTRHLVADCKVEPNVQVDGLSVFQFNTNYGGTSVAALDAEGVSSSTLTSGQATPPATYIVKYDANGATGGSVPSPQYKTQYKDITLATNDGNLTRIGYSFSGWNTSPDGTGDDYAEGATYSADAGVTLYADWTEVTDVTFNRSSGSVDHGDDVIIYPPTGAIIYYRTDEGATWENGTQDKPVTIKLYNEKYKPQSSDEVDIGIPEDGSVTITAYARYADGSQSTETTGTYSLKKYTVTYDGNSKYGIESTVSGDVPQKQEFYSGASIIIAEQGTLKRVAHTFGGWNTKNDGSGETYNAGDSYRFTGDTPLYAKWVPMTDFYVSSSTGSDQDLSHDGSESKPFKTIGRALHFINQFNNGTQSFIIHVSGNCVAEAIDDNNSVVNIVPDKTLNLTIQGKDGNTATIDANNHGRVMYIGANAKVILQNITLTGGSADYGGGVYIASGGSLTLGTGATISGNTGTYIGGGVYSDGTLIMETGSSIKNNTANDQGGGVFINNGEFTMSGGTISGNTVTSGNGGGVFVKDTGSTFTMSDNATISGNAATEGGGVYSTGILNMIGGTISGNEATGTIGTDIGNGGGVYNTGTFKMSDGTISGNKATGGNGTDTGLGGGVYNTGTFEMSGGTIGGTTDDDKNTASLQGGGVYINDGSFTMSGGTISGNEAAAGRSGLGGGVFVNSGAFTMIDNATISNNKAAISAGGVYNSRGKFTMESGSISGNTASNGGGVYNTFTFEMSGGTISGNEAAKGGGVYNSSTFTMSGGTISRNTATNDGGGVYNTSSFEMTGGTISGNETTAVSVGSGGGVYNTSSFTMSGEATISENTSSYYGGGVFNISSFEMTGGTISGNEAENGGGVITTVLDVGDVSSFKMSGGTISENTASFHGGGVMVFFSSTFTMSGGTITRNEVADVSSGLGGGVYNYNGTFNYNGGTISGNNPTDIYP